MFKLLIIFALCSQVDNLKYTFSDSTAPTPKPEQKDNEQKITYRELLEFINKLPKDKLDNLLVIEDIYNKETKLLDEQPPIQESEEKKEENEEDIQPAFVKFTSVRSQNSALGKVLSDIDSHLPAGHQYRDSDKITWGHETTHGINSEIRNKYSRSGKVNAFYCLEDRGVVIREPNTTIRTVASKVPPSLRGDVYDLYLVSQAGGWNDTPLYIFDEWVAYTNGSAVRKDLKISSRAESVQYMMEFNIYALTLAKVVKERGGYNDTQFKAFLKWNIKRTMSIFNNEERAERYLSLFRKNKDAESLRKFSKEYLGEKWCKEILKF